MPLSSITANRVRDGAAVWRTAGGGWSVDVADAAVLDTAEAELDAAKADIAARLVTDVYAVEVEPGPDGPVPVRLRERIRATGPTVRPDLVRAPL
jgi:hypothetical protein